MKNILRQANEKTKVIAMRIDPNSLQEESEKELAALIPQTVATVEKLRAKRTMKAPSSRSQSCVPQSTSFRQGHGHG